MSTNKIRVLMENALSKYTFEECTSELLEEMHQSAIKALPSNITVGYLRSFFKDIPTFWADDHIVYVEQAEEYEVPHVEFNYGDSILFRFCARLEGVDY